MILPVGLAPIPILIAALGGTALLAQDSTSGPDAPLVSVTSIRFWSLAGTTRVAVQTGGEVRYRVEKLYDPPRLLVDLPNTRLQIVERGTHVVKVGDQLVRQIRVAQNDLRRTRIVLDLEVPVEHEISQLVNPPRLMIELRTADSRAGRNVITLSRPGGESPAAPAPAAAKPEPAPPVKSVSPPSEKQERTIASAARPAPAPPAKQGDSPVIRLDPPPTPEPKPAAEPREEPRAAEAIPYSRPAEVPASVSPPSTSSAPPASYSAAAPAQKRSGVRSLTRALGLKLETVVLDPGHGGYDQGTAGPSGLLEKDLVLDISQRLGALIEQRLGSKVVYTRDSDQFVPLEERTAIANQNRADLFLSLHANSSPYASISGAEVYYLNFSTSKDALDVAARENASHGKSIFELRELVQKIALKEKLDESRDLASKLQTQLSSSWSKMNAGARNRGVKKAPFVVLIGASMPSVLVEMGFISNARDEALLKRPDQRQRLAEALYRGIELYANAFGSSPVARSANGQEE